MVGVQDQVEPDKIGKFRIVITEHASVVRRPVEGGIVIDRFTLIEPDAVDGRCDGRQFGQQLEAVLKGCFPVVFLLHPLVVTGTEYRLVFKGAYPCGKHGHRVRCLGHGLQYIDQIVGHFRALSEFVLDALNICFAWKLSDTEKVEGLLGCPIYQIENRNTADYQPIFRSNQRGVTDKPLDTAHTTVCLLQGYIRDLCVAVFFNQTADLFP